jgi:hypothetical protein
VLVLVIETGSIATMPIAVMDGTGIKTSRRSQPRSGSFRFAVARWRVRHQRGEQLLRTFRHMFNSVIEGVFVRFGRLGETAQFPHELQ